ncbi:MAG: alpha/beta fold hydrolase [Rhodobacteraceae bacterium]|nr:alpha/beta fold hydrolase [Paracoccaceae bacterium]
MDWTAASGTWPNSVYSSFFRVRPHDWHVQIAGTGPTVLLLHGAGGATQSWRGIFEPLTCDFQVIAPDLPGQGFTKMGTRQRCGLRPMAEDLAALCKKQKWAPDLIIGHSAGGALALELDRLLAPKGIVGINAALGKFQGIAGWLFPIMAKVMALSPFVPALFARLSGNERRVRELLDSTGSKLDDRGIGLYQTLVSDRGHVDATLAMMAQWQIDPLLDALPGITTPALFITGAEDGAVPPGTSSAAAAKMPNAEVIQHAGYGHLIHEEAPDTVISDITSFAARLKLLPPGQAEPGGA